jgi:hypothetical protein
MLEWKKVTPLRCAEEASGYKCTYFVNYIKDKWVGFHRDDTGEHILYKGDSSDKAHSACETHAAEQLRKHMEWAGVPDYRKIIGAQIREACEIFVGFCDKGYVYVEYYHEHKVRIEESSDDPNKEYILCSNLDGALAAALELVENEKVQKLETE